MIGNRLKIAHALLIYGSDTLSEDHRVPKNQFLVDRALVGRVQGAENLTEMWNAKILAPPKHLRFGPALGLVLGLSVGTESLRAVLVDANGVVVAECEALPQVNRLRDVSPEQVLAEIKAAARAVLTAALEDDELLIERKVDGRAQSVLPLVGVSTGWPSPLDMSTKIPIGRYLSHRWSHAKRAVDTEVALALGSLNLERWRSHALPEAHAVAVGAAFDASRTADSHESDRVHTAMTIRIGGGLSGAAMVIESHRTIANNDKADTLRQRGSDGFINEFHVLGEDTTDRARVSGFCWSRVIGGCHSLAGTIGHVPITAATLERCDDRSPEELAPLDLEWRCNCDEKKHIGAFASALGLVRRFRATRALGHWDEKWPPAEGEGNSILEGFEDVKDLPLVKDALYAIGRLVGTSIRDAVLLLDPKTITVVGPIVTDEVREGIEKELGVSRARGHGATPQVRLLMDDENTYAVPRGAALAVFQEQVFRRLPLLLPNPGELLRLVHPVTSAMVEGLSR